MHTNYVVPCENGLRCNVKELNYAAHCWRGTFHFSVSRYNLQQLHQTTHRHKLMPEQGCWLNLDGFHMGVGGDDSWSRSVLSEFTLQQNQYFYQITWK